MAAAEHVPPVLETIRLGDEIPDIPFRTDQGSGSLREYEKDSWLLLFSYPKDMTPVCATVSLRRRLVGWYLFASGLLAALQGVADRPGWLPTSPAGRSPPAARF